jgi:hypothetical protein
MSAPSEQANLQAVGCRGDRSRAPSDGPRRSYHHVLPEDDRRLGKPIKETVVDHGLSAFGGLLARLKHCH